MTLRRTLISAAAALVALGSPAAALAAGPTPAQHKPTHKPAHKPTHGKPAPARPTQATARLYLYNAFFVHHSTVVVPGRPVRVTGIVRPYVSDQNVTLTAYLGHRKLSSHRLRVRPVPHGSAGQFVGTVVAPRAGTLHLEATHRRSPRMSGLTARRGATVVPIDPHSSLWASLVQQQLAKRHLYMPQSGTWDLQTMLAIDAYHRLLRRGTSETLDGRTLTDLLDGHGAFPVRYPHDGHHAEGNLGLQLVALIDGSKVVSLYPMSSGKPSTPTILGRYQIYRRVPGYLPDGMYYSDFFIRGYAIHGYEPAPDYPASHGCMRIPISDAISAFNWLGMGDWVDVYQ